NSYMIDKASLTTCDGDRPAWKITGRNLKITVEGHGSVQHAALRARNIPVLYAPYFVFPVTAKRQSGLLIPEMGISNRKGVEYMQPFYWAINKSSDATFYGHYMERRGTKVGFEYRYIRDNLSKGTLMVDYLNDRQVDDGTGDSSEKWGYPDDDALRPNTNRYWFRTKLDQKIPSEFNAKLDLDIVSDQDYLVEFKDGYTGYNTSNDYFIEQFGRGFDDYNDAVRTSLLNFNRTWSAYSLNGQLQWNDNVVNRRQSDTDTTLQRLPFIEFDASKQQIKETAFYFDLDSEYTHFFRMDGPKGHRLDAHPRLYFPYRFRDYFTFEPSAGFRGTVWHTDEEKNSRYFNREMFDAKLDLSSEFFRVYDFSGTRVKRFKHTLRPQVVYMYIPDIDQTQLPLFDSIDRIEKENSITYRLTNFFTTRARNPAKKKISMETGEVSHNESSDDVYQNFGRLELSQSYDFDEAREIDPEPFSPVRIDLELFPVDYLSMQADADYSIYDNTFLSRNLAMRILDKRGDQMFVEHRYTRDANESIYFNLIIKLTERLKAYTEYERDIFDENDLKRGVGILYKAQCWSIDLNYFKELEERKISFMVHLFGLGGIGSSI
ncbi:LPS-assembly protein LptD, partial [Thermodesulfobacteriota bacterium]